MRFAFLQNVDFERVSFDMGRQFSQFMKGKGLVDEDSAAQRNIESADVFGAVDDSFSEAVNFRFNVRGVEHRGAVTHDALRDRHGVPGVSEPELALFIRHAPAIGRAAMIKQARSRSGFVVLESGDL